jgi:hypothetical protein
MESKRFAFALALGVTAAIETAAAAVIVTTDNAVIAAFQSGATVNTLEAFAGLPTTALFDGTPLPGANQIYKINGGHFHSGGASFNDLTGNPGAPSGVLELDPSFLAGNARSGNHVLATTHAGDSADPANATLCADGACFFEVEFTSPIAKFGGWIGAGNVKVLIKDRIKQPDGSDDTLALEFFDVKAGEFFGVTNALANIDSITISATGNSFLLDDITTAGAGTGGGGGTVPLPGSLALLVAGLASLRRFSRRDAQ